LLIHVWGTSNGKRATREGKAVEKKCAEGKIGKKVGLFIKQNKRKGCGGLILKGRCRGPEVCGAFCETGERKAQEKRRGGSLPAHEGAEVVWMTGAASYEAQDS